MQEDWRELSFLPNYLISSKGTVINKKTKRKLKHQIKKGYHRLELSTINGRKHFLVHRLVAQAFIPNPQNKPQVNHIDGNKDNNAVENLEWCTNYENAHHAIKNGLWENVFKASAKTNESRKIKCKAINKAAGNEIYFESISEAEKYFNNKHICDVLKGKRHSVQGYIMQYI